MSHDESLALFHRRPKQENVVSAEYVDYRCTGQLNSEGALEFHVSSNSSRYLDLKKTRIKLRFRILKANGNVLPKIPTDGTKVPLEANVAPVNLFLQTMWRQVDVSLQQQVISPNIATKYAYKAYMETLLSFGEAAKNSKLQSQLFYKDDTKVEDADSIEGENAGLVNRAAFTQESKACDLEGPLLIDILETSRYVPHGVPIHVKLWHNSNPFRLMSNNPSADYKIEIMDAVLRMYQIEVAPKVVVAQAEVFTQKPAIYYYPRTEMKSFAIAKGQFSATLEDVYQGEIPNTMLIGLVKSEAYNGSYKENPFNFCHFNLNHIALYVNGHSTPGVPLTPDFKAGNYLPAYMTLFNDHYMEDSGIYITREEYPKGYCLFKFDTCKLHCPDVVAETKKGHSRLEVRFSEALPEAVTMIIAAKFPGELEIDQSRNVRVINSS